MKTIGNWAISALLFSLLSFSAQAALQATIDRSEVPQDESVTLKINHSGQGPLNPKFDAPDFEIVNQFENSQFSSVYVNGKFENTSQRNITYILRPLKTGTLRIKNISNGGEHTQDLSVQVIAENSYKKTVPGNSPSLSGDNKYFFVKAETGKSKVYKGEQLIVSYYLYRRTRTNLRDVMQYPTFQGFIREDLEMPMLGRPDFEAVNMGGVPFERGLLARYAIYPIQEGKLKIDSLSIRADYIPKNSGNDDAFEDPFFQFFSQVTPRTGISKSDPISIDVQPLPQEGKTSSFTGGVGVFDVTAQIDPGSFKTNAPLTLHLSVRGKGNASMVEFPPVNWPKGLRFYESQGKSKNLGQGNTEKTFEVVLVPLQKGEIEIPSVEFQFFNPESQSYVMKKTASVKIQVAEGDAASAPTIDQFVQDSANKIAPAEPTKFGSLRLKEEVKNEGPSSFIGQPWWRWVAWFGLLVFFSFLGLIAFDTTKKRSLARLELLKRKQGAESFWNKLQKDCENLIQNQATQEQFSPLLEETVDQIYQALDETFSMQSRAMPRRELGKTLTEMHGLSLDQWSKISRILEFTEMVRFASKVAGSMSHTGPSEVPGLIQDARTLCLEITHKKDG